LNKLELIDILNKKVLVDKIPVLGICLGMQLMGKMSEEGNSVGLSWFDAEFKKFNLQMTQYPIKVPCIGWNEVAVKKSSRLFEGIDQPRFYFVHSYHAVCHHASDILAEAEYGYRYTAAYERDNIYGVQFHPEKSHKYGLLLFQNFITFCK
jgi:imidazole glycerol-phosphate synthase subunit HisH